MMRFVVMARQPWKVEIRGMLAAVACLVFVLAAWPGTLYAECHDGVWKTVKKDLTAGGTGGERLDIVFGVYWAHVGVEGETRIAEFRHTEAPGKFRELQTWHPDQVGELRDRSREWKETCSGDRLVQTSIQEAQEGGKNRVQYTSVRVPTKPSALDGAWTLRFEDLTTKARLADGITVIRYGDYIGLFRQPRGAQLVAQVMRMTSPGKWTIVFSTEKSEVNQVVDLCLDCAAEPEGQTRRITWTMAGDTTTGALRAPKGHRVSATLSPFDVHSASTK
jgi:hypothetical protein